MDLSDFQKKKRQLPDAPGVYFFLGPKREILYIGKASSLRDRVRSYFSPDLSEARSSLIVQMVQKARSIDWRETDSVLEALILEASLIKTHKPHHNTLEKDDKSFNYVVITDEYFPRVIVVRGKELSSDRLYLKTKTQKLKAVFGPFPHGAQLKDAMKIIRKIFPFRDRCESCVFTATSPALVEVLGEKGVKQKKCRPCFNRQIGLCPGVCTGEISADEYSRTIKHISLLFGGHKKKLLKALESDMRRAAKNENFEEAARLRKQLFAMQHIQDVSLIKENSPHSNHLLIKEMGQIRRVEAYDTAHWQGSAAVGVMVVLENGEPEKSEYRTFKIKTAKAGDDTGALYEILSRRLAHGEWPLPRLFVIDGGKAQLSVAEKTIQNIGLKIPVVSVVKDEHHKACGILGDTNSIKKYEKEILLANYEAHRFSLSKHRNNRKNL